MDNNKEGNKKIPTNLVSKEERYLRMFFTYIRLGQDKKQSKKSLVNLLLKDKNAYTENLEKLKNNWITVYYNIYDYFICKEDNMYTYFFNDIIYLCKEDETEINKELKELIISIMKICLRIYPPQREDVINFYQLFRMKDLNKKIFSELMNILNMIYSCDKTVSTHKEYFSNFSDKNFFLFDGNSHIEIKFAKDWLTSGFKLNPNKNSSKTYFVFGFSFRYFKKNENQKLCQMRFPSSKYFVLAIKNDMLISNMKFKNDIQIPLNENTNYTFTMAFLKDRVQIYINDNVYDTTEGIAETAKNIIIGEKFFGLFYKVFATFSFEQLELKEGTVVFTYPENDTGEKFHCLFVEDFNIYENLGYPKQIYFRKKDSLANVTFSGRVLFFKTEKTYLKTLKKYGNFGVFSILLMFFIYKPEYYKKEYLKLIFDKIYENCSIPDNEKLFSDNCYFVQYCIILCNFPKENRDLELIDYLAPLIKYSSSYNYYFDILKVVYEYCPEKNKQPFSFHLIEIMIKKILDAENVNQLNEVKEILLSTLEHYNLRQLVKKENIAEDIYYSILNYFENYKSSNENIYFNTPNYFWFIILYIFFFELKNKIKEIEIIYQHIKENIYKNEIIEDNDDNKKIIQLVNYYILLYHKEKVDYNFEPKNDKQRNIFLYICYIFKLYSRYKKSYVFESEINKNLIDSNYIFSKNKYQSIEDYKDKTMLYFLIPTVNNLPLITKSFKKEENKYILELLCEDFFSKQPKYIVLSNSIKLFKNICINLKYTDTESNGYLVYYIKNEIFKQLKKYDFKVENSFYTGFSNDTENAKILSININTLFGDLYQKLDKDKKDKVYDHDISEEKVKDYFDPSNDMYQSDYSITNSSLEEVLSNMISRRNWIKTTLDEHIFYNQNWTDIDFCYNPDNTDAKFVIKNVMTNDLKCPFLYRIPDITSSIKHRNRKGMPKEKLSDLFKEEPKEPFPVCIHISLKEIKQKLDFVFKYHGDMNLNVEKEYLKDNKKKYPCCVLGGVIGKGFFYVKDEKTIEYQNYHELDKAEYYEYIDNLNGVSIDKNYFYNPVKVYRITIEKESIKMFFKRINYYSDQGLEIFLYLGGSWNFTFKGNRDEFLKEAGLIPKDEDFKDFESDKKSDDIYVSQWRKQYLFRPLYNDLDSSFNNFSKNKSKPIGYISKYFRFPGENKYWDNCRLSDILNRWKDHKISTYTLIMYLNFFSNRSIEDKTQNIIMPQLILIDNENKAILRDLKLPMGQQKIENNEKNIQRLAAFDDIYINEKDKKNAYFYPCSISCQKNVIKNLSTLIPFNQASKNIYNDKNNILISLNKDIIDSLTNINNVYESPTEFFYLSECLTNINNLKDYSMEGIELPSCNIINNSDYNFDKNVIYTLTLNKIMESKEVNDTIGNWIDLIYGVDQHSEKLKNIYKPECYLDDESQLEIFKNNKEIIKNVPFVGFLPKQIIKSNKFNSIVTRKYLPLNLNFPVKETLTVKLVGLEEKDILNFTALDSQNYIFFGENSIWNITTKGIKNGHSFFDYEKNNKIGVLKEIYNPKNFKKISAVSRLYNYSVHGGNADNVLMFYNHRKLSSAYNQPSKNKNFITAVEIIEYVGYEHYLLVGKQNGNIHHYKVDFETLDDLIKYPDDNQYPAYFYKSILHGHSKEIISIKYSEYLNLWISTAKDGYVHLWNFSGDLILSVYLPNKNIKYAILSSDPLPSFLIYFDNEIDCYLLNQIKPIRKLDLKTEVYNLDIIKSNGFEDYLLCQDDEKMYVISIPYLEIVYEINEKLTSFDYLANERLIIGFLRHEDESKVTIKKIQCDI